MVITNGIYLDKLIELRLPDPARPDPDVELLHHTPAPLVKDPSYDRGNVYTMAWQSGITGIGYNPKLVGKEITSWDDLLDPTLKGKIGMFADNRGPADLRAVRDRRQPRDLDAGRLEEGRRLAEEAAAAGAQVLRAGLHRRRSSKGDIWATMAWSGDIFQANPYGAGPASSSCPRRAR